MTVTPDNISDIYSIAKIVKDIGVDFFRAVPVLKIGKAKKYFIPEDFYSQVIAEMLLLRSKLNIQLNYNIKLGVNLYEAYKDFFVSCPAGEHSLTLSETGYLRDCPLLSSSTINKYNVIQKDIYDFKNELKIAKDKNVNNKYSDCYTCSIEEKCKKTCLAELNNDNMFCFKNIWQNAINITNKTLNIENIVNDLLIDKYVSEKYGTKFCYRSLPFWIINFN